MATLYTTSHYYYTGQEYYQSLSRVQHVCKNKNKKHEES